MGMKNTIRELIQARSITAYRFWKDVGCSRDVAYRLVNDPSYIPRESVMEMICRAYALQPGDFLIYVPED